MCRRPFSSLSLVSMLPRAPTSTLFPYTTLFRSHRPKTDERATGVARNDVAQGVSGNSQEARQDRKSTRLNSSHQIISYAVFCLKKKKETTLSRIPHVLHISPRTISVAELPTAGS